MTDAPYPPEEPAAEGDGGLRAAFAGLTTRGRSFLAAGVAAVVCAYVLGQEGLLRVGLLLAVLPVACVLVLHRTRHRITGSRRLSPSRVSAAQEAQVRLRVENASRLPTGLLLIEDQVPWMLGPHPRFVVDRMGPGGHREVSYRVRADLRGRYPLGPLRLRLTDPFGMCEIPRAFGTRAMLTVVPYCEPLPPVRHAGDAAGRGDGHLRTLALAGDDDIIPRGYRHGDDVRRIHWRATARHGELMVRREEQQRRAHCTVLLDTRGVAYAGAGPGTPFERAVSAAASVAVHLLQLGFTVRLLTDTGAWIPGPEGVGGRADPADAAGVLLDALAVIDHSEGIGLSGAHDALRGVGEGLLVAFFGGLDQERAVQAAGLRQRGTTAIGFLLDPAAWPGAHPGTLPGAAGPLGLLRAGGWTALPMTPYDPLPDLWRLAGSPAGRAAGEGGVVTGDGRAGGWT
ncbi:DUF58 domain-containing protein [Streptomyces sp. I05A-00742]|uniref:DUF58 domain-containing protein n=1 Tax=Streptomyces sp. I05A-00742 TaxID=2732853 RepID=UPI001487A043|nr:DUF58 domain-containing protein [Streptomyces sp. I05A-00742]